MFDVPSAGWMLAVELDGGNRYCAGGGYDQCDRAIFLHQSGRFVCFLAQAHRPEDVVAAGDTFKVQRGDGPAMILRCTAARIWNLGVVAQVEPASEGRDK